MVEDNNFINLNFLPLTSQKFSFTIFRKPYKDGEKREQYPDCIKYELPIDPERKIKDKSNRSNYWVSFVQSNGFDLFECQQGFNLSLTQQFLYFKLKLKCQGSLLPSEYEASKNDFRKSISFTLNTSQEGTQSVWLEPYYLEVEGKFGFLVDFEFRKNKDIPFSRKVQQLSLSLDKNLRSNNNFYVDKYQKVQSFLRLYYSRLFPFPLTDKEHINVSQEFLQLPSGQLDVKRYIFASGKEKNSQFNGIKDFGPLERIERDVLLYFIFRKQDTEFANQLYLALKGTTFQSTFAGMDAIFGVPVERSVVRGKPLQDFDQAGFMEIIDEIKKITNFAVIPILLLPSKFDPTSNQVYYLAKYLFIRESLPLQVVTLDVLRDNLKWSISNIGLQIFSKLGGKPWIVKPCNDKCLIIGIGQSHKIVKEGAKFKVEKYFAYSVLTDSSGLYLDLEVLGHANDEKIYIDQLKSNLTNVLRNRQNQFSKFVIHTPFKLKKYEMESIKESLELLNNTPQQDSRDFVVLKINTQPKFFGYNTRSNSLVPFESSFVQLSHTEYLVWFEGLQYHNPNVYKRFSGPTHLQFFYSTPGTKGKEKNYLQDALNLSGANWRGFNAKSLPVSILYCQLVSKFIQEFESYGYTDYKINNLQPWFL